MATLVRVRPRARTPRRHEHGARGRQARRAAGRAGTCATALAVSDRGRAGIAVLAGQTARLLNAQGFQARVFPAQMAFNLLAQDDAPDVAAELRRIFGDAGLAIDSCAHYVPVFYAHSHVIRLETTESLSLEKVRKLLRATPGIKLRDKDEELSPVGDSAGGAEILVGQIRPVGDGRNGLLLWILADNVKGAAVNAVHVAESLLKDHP